MKNNIDKAIMESRLRPRVEDIRGAYFRDQTAIIHSSAFRRLKHKTQVFFAPENDHICTRIEHVLHVSTVAETICKGLIHEGWDLNPEIAYAAGLGHDLGHAPFGHSGERGINKCTKTKFMHEVNSLRVVDKLANDGKGLNLTFAVRDAIVCHCGEVIDQYLVPNIDIIDLEQKKSHTSIPATWEGCAVRFADKIAYLGRDIEDALLAGIITIDDVPDNIRVMLGKTNGEIINTLVIDIIHNTQKMGMMGFSDEKHKLFKELYKFNYNHIYGNVNKQTYEKYCVNIVMHIFNHLYDSFDRIMDEDEHEIKFEAAFKNYVLTTEGVYQNGRDDAMQAVTDYVAGMTDNYAIAAFKETTMPKPVAFM